ncbi:helix-turn-helix transcriptional regulator [Streptomyces californicus]|uniref:helix-turn-helix transcriptional regulator n=1 Tax=Streptomyces californicus TaxID=67351 RepID=UPI00371E863B
MNTLGQNIPDQHTRPPAAPGAGPRPGPIPDRSAPHFVLDPRQREIAEDLLAGRPPDGATDRMITSLLTGTGVLTVRALCFRLLALGLVPQPGPLEAPHLDPLTRAVWEGLRWDIPDVDLATAVASELRHHEEAVPSAGAVDGALDGLRQRYATTPHGLVRVGFACGILSPGLGTAAPEHGMAIATPPGAGAWDATPAQRRVLAMRASGRSNAACARAEGTTVSSITGRLNTVKKMPGVCAPRALIHRALADGVLRQPALQERTIPEQERAVWQHFATDVPDNALAARIGTHTGLGMNIVDGHMHALRLAYRDDCAVVHEGWRHGVLTAATRTDLTCCADIVASAPVSGGAR